MIHTDLSFESYLKLPQLSQSVLKHGRDSMKHLKAAWDESRSTEPTDDMLLGSALHCAFLEPELMPERVALWTGPRRAGNEWKAFEAENAGKIILTKGMHESLVGMVRSLREAIRSEPELRRWHSQIEGVEVTIIGEINGVPMKGRIDALTPDPLFDLKKVSNGDPYLFRSKAWELGYAIQAFVYTQLAERDRFIILTVEDYPPYDVVCHEVDEELMQAGAKEACAILNRVQECLQTGKWPGRAQGIQSMGVPDWVKNQKVRI